MGYARDAANRTGRTFVVEYDLSGMATDRLYDTIVRDWKFLVDDMKITQDARYLHEGGKPVLAIFGFFSDRFSPTLAHRLIDFFKTNEKYRVCLIGGCQWPWRTEEDVEWARAFRRFDIISPWNIGNAVMCGLSGLTGDFYDGSLSNSPHDGAGMVHGSNGWVEFADNDKGGTYDCLTVDF